jgi:hypothetical protein
MGNRLTRKDKLAAIAKALIGKRYDEHEAVIGLHVPYQFIELDGKRTGHNTDSVRGVVLIWHGADDRIYRTHVGTVKDDRHAHK